MDVGSCRSSVMDEGLAERLLEEIWITFCALDVRILTTEVIRLEGPMNVDTVSRQVVVTNSCTLTRRCVCLPLLTVGSGSSQSESN